ncbi:hypothetical protein L195_g050978, partial [Trifolium pratense]
RTSSAIGLGFIGGEYGTALLVSCHWCCLWGCGGTLLGRMNLIWYE